MQGHQRLPAPWFSIKDQGDERLPAGPADAPTEDIDSGVCPEIQRAPLDSTYKPTRRNLDGQTQSFHCTIKSNAAHARKSGSRRPGSLDETAYIAWTGVMGIRHSTPFPIQFLAFKLLQPGISPTMTSQISMPEITEDEISKSAFGHMSPVHISACPADEQRAFTSTSRGKTPSRRHDGEEVPICSAVCPTGATASPSSQSPSSPLRHRPPWVSVPRPSGYSISQASSPDSPSRALWITSCRPFPNRTAGGKNTLPAAS